MSMNDRVFVSLEHDPTVSVFDISAADEGGLVDANESEQGIPHLREHLVARHGSFRGVPIRRALSAIGGVIQASTHPFHVEYHATLPLDADDDIAAVAAEVVHYWATAGAQRFEHDAIETEMSSIEHELEERLLRGVSSLFPWTEIFNTVTSRCSAGRNLLLDVPNHVEAAVEGLSRFADRTRSMRTSISVVCPVPLDRIAELLCERGYSTTAVAPRAPALREEVRFSESRALVRRVRGLRNAVHAAAHPVGAGISNSSRAQASAAVAARTLNRIAIDGRWQAGVFGPFAGPDSELVIYAGHTPWDEVEMPASIDGAVVDRARADALRELRTAQSAPSTRARQRAVSVLFGTSPNDVARLMDGVTADHVRQIVSEMGDGRLGRLTWLPTDE